MLKQRHQLFVVLMAIADALVIALASYTAWGVRRGTIEGFPPASWETWFKEPLVAFTVPITITMFWFLGLYRPRRDRSIWSELAGVARASFAALGALIVVLWISGNDAIEWSAVYGVNTLLGLELDAGRTQLGSLLIALPVLLAFERATFRLALRALRRRGWNLRHVLIIGSGRLGQIACRTIHRNSWTGIHVAAFLSHHERSQRKECLGRPVLGGLEDLERVMESNEFDAVYIAVPSARAAVMPTVLRTLERFVVDVRIIPDVHPRFMPQNMTVNELEGMPILSVRECPLYGLGGFSKRLIDMVGASLLLLVLSPVMGVIALIIAATSPGPVIFRQRRVSLAGEEFNIYKFRSMTCVPAQERGRQPHAGEGTAGPDGEVIGWTRVNDGRITPIGKWLRRTSLDELPQLINVLRGDMSLVGPRPERPELIERFREDWRGYMLRQHVKAGMTGWAQVNGLRGQTSLKKRLQYDLFYIRHWSVWFDLRILFLTLFRLTRGAH